MILALSLIAGLATVTWSQQVRVQSMVLLLLDKTVLSRPNSSMCSIHPAVYLVYLQQYVCRLSSGMCSIHPAVRVPSTLHYVFYPSSSICAFHPAVCVPSIQRYVCLPSSGMCAVHASAFSFTCRPYGGQLAATFQSATRWRNYPRATTFSLLASNR